MCVLELTAILNQYRIKNLVTGGRVLANFGESHWTDVTQWSRLQLAKKLL